MSQQAQFFFWTVLLGLGVGVAYDAFRIIRKTFKHPDFLTQLEDLAYWVLVSVLVFYFILHRNFGEVRIYSIIGIITGTSLYFATFSVAVMKVSVALIDLLKKIIASLFRLMIFPFKLLIKLLGYPARKLQTMFIQLAQNASLLLKKSNRYAKIKAGRMKRDFFIIRTKI
jgi:spore cortex biosynthesis protein YabQ